MPKSKAPPPKAPSPKAPPRAAKPRESRKAKTTPGTNGVLAPLGLGEQLGGAAIGRTWLDTRGPALTVRSPIDGHTLATVRAASPADVQRAIEAAEEAFKSWRLIPAPN